MALCAATSVFGAAATITVNTTNKTGVVSGAVAIREMVTFTIVNLDGTASTNLSMTIMTRDNETVATGSSFTNAGANAVGDIDLNTDELVLAFSNSSPTATMTYKFGIWDSVVNTLLISDSITLQANPYTSAGDASAANDARYVLRAPPTGSYRISTNGAHIQLWDYGTEQWRSLYVLNGALTLSEGED